MQYCCNTALLIADLIIKNYNVHSRTRTEVLRNFVKFSFTGYNVLESYITSSPKSSSGEREEC